MLFEQLLHAVLHLAFKIVRLAGHFLQATRGVAFVAEIGIGLDDKAQPETLRYCE